ncbi:unnamed protein product [Ambrosiozyma monospora]|uniref:Geranylgeranyl transferase type-2 subunit alpha n=1 Tax=Ambrosiozyma monospora TaxID=43982 RepID=A0A9W6WJ43_AMBMO|nr:unnamed protein product [Ambrosiozyma monospora]
MFFQADSRNFHAWQYRRFIIQCYKESLSSDDAKIQVDWDEFKFTTKMINKDISNYSAWHNRSKLIEKLFISSPDLKDDNDVYLQFFNAKDKLKFLRKELDLIKTAFYTDPDDSSVWIYLKWLFGDYYTKDLPKNESRKLLEDTIKDIDELNELETEDNGFDNQWCLKIGRKEWLLYVINLSS